MKPPSYQYAFEPFLENRKAFLELRWLVVILASYLMLFSRLDSQNIVGILVLAAAFAMSNVAIMYLPMRHFVRARSSHWITVADGVFLSICFYVLRVDDVAIHFPIIGIFLVTLVSKDLKLVLTSLLVTSILFGALASLSAYGLGNPGAVEQFLTLALLFVVATFYVFLTDRFERDASYSTSLLKESRNSEIMIEITRILAASMNLDEIYRVVVTRLCEVMDGVECCVVRIEGDEAIVLARSETMDGDDPNAIPLDSAPVLRQATDEKSTAIRPLVPGTSESHRFVQHTLAIPMVARGEVLGVIYVPGIDIELETPDSTIHFMEVVASAAANALRNVHMFEEVKHLAQTDFLTGLPNQRYFQSSLSREVGRAHRHGQSLSLLLIDLDLLKAVNDRFGHQAGDRVIRTVADTIRNTCREIDFAARYGGEEFVVILPATDLSGAVLVAERILKNIELTDTGIDAIVTASIGLANDPVNATTGDDLIRVADQALYVAKDGGRNQIAHFKYQFTTF